MPEGPGETAASALAPPALEPVRVLVPSPLGPLGVELSGQTVSRLLIAPGAREKRDFKPFAKMRSSELLDEIFGRLSEYLAGARRHPQIEFNLGPCGVDSFARRILRETCKVPYGKTRTYQAIAEAAGRPEAYRQALSVLMANPIPILIPCHRVVPLKAGIGNYVAGPRRKRWLLRLEERGAAAAPPPG